MTSLTSGMKFHRKNKIQLMLTYIQEDESIHKLENTERKTIISALLSI